MFQLMPLPLILASGSRFRRQMLENAGLTFTVVPATVDEPAARAAMVRDNPAITPGDVALKLAALKAVAVSERHRHALVIGSDQVLALGSEIFGKPPTPAPARAQLERLSGRTHTLPTGAVLAQNGQVVWQHLGVATLQMRTLTPTFLDDYMTRAGPIVTETVGGYALEGLGVQLFDRIDGDYFTIIGLPLLAVLGALRERGVVGN
jgi:septum formation protein